MTRDMLTAVFALCDRLCHLPTISVFTTPNAVQFYRPRISSFWLKRRPFVLYEDDSVQKGFGCSVAAAAWTFRQSGAKGTLTDAAAAAAAANALFRTWTLPPSPPFFSHRAYGPVLPSACSWNFLQVKKKNTDPCCCCCSYLCCVRCLLNLATPHQKSNAAFRQTWPIIPKHSRSSPWLTPCRMSPTSTFPSTLCTMLSSWPLPLRVVSLATAHPSASQFCALLLHTVSGSSNCCTSHPRNRHAASPSPGCREHEPLAFIGRCEGTTPFFCSIL